MSSLGTALLKRRGTTQWDVVLRGMGIAALVALYPTLRWPDVGGLVAFLGVTMFVNGPLAPFLPAAYEPILMVMGRVYPWWLVGLVGVAGILFIEYVNYYLYRAAIMHPRLAGARQARLVRVALTLFERSPFLAVWLCAWSPLPYWAVRVLAPLSGYPVARYLLATFLGRLPRVWFFAALGPVVPASTSTLVALTVVAIVLGIAVCVARRRDRAGEPAVQPLRA